MTESTSTAAASGGQRVAIVTGAARGIGAAVAARLAADGFAVAVLDLDEARLRGHGRRRHGGRRPRAARRRRRLHADAVRAAVARVAAELGPPAVLVNNAGIIRDNLLFKMTDDDWDTVLGVHLRGVLPDEPRRCSST